MQIIKDKIPVTKNYADYLIQKGKEYEQHKQLLFTQKLKTESADPELTFTPAILKKATRDKSVKLDKFEQLYQTGKIKTQKKREAEEKDADLIEKEKNPEAYTFSPTVHEVNQKALAAPSMISKRSKSEKAPPAEPAEPKRVFKKSPKKIIKKPVADNTVGPETVKSKVNQSQQHSEYGTTNYLDDMENNSMFNATQSVIDNPRSDEPHLNIDIEIGHKKHRVTLFKDSNCPQIATDFAKTHGLPKEMQTLLEKQL